MNQDGGSSDGYRIVILGGGSAGWMTAALLAATSSQRMRIELVESSAIATVGVGEGSVPKLAALFEALGISECEWMPACDATFKNGIQFDGWSDKPGYEGFFHGFYSHFDRDHFKALRFNSVLRRARMDVHAHPDTFIYNSYLARRRLAPKPAYSFPFEVQYAYHFDAAKLGEFLKQWSIKRGVGWRDCTVAACEQRENGDIDHLITTEGNRIEADLFVDCSGFAGYLIEGHMGAKHLSFDHLLFNDSAIAVPSERIENPAPMTTATALPHGWAWHIPLQSRTGNGYVYSSRYVDRSSAEAEFRAHLGSAGADAELRHLSMRVGRLDRPWIGNCVAIGLSQGFLEPLEATGLMLTQYTVTQLIRHLYGGRPANDAKERFNADVGAAFDGVRDFIVGHYLTASRSDTQYWRDISKLGDNLSDNLKSVFATWKSGGDLDALLVKRGMSAYFSVRSWYYMLCGKGVFPPGTLNPPRPDLLSKVPIGSIVDMLDRCTQNHPSHAETLASLATTWGDEGSVPSCEEARKTLFAAMADPSPNLARHAFDGI